MISFQRAFDEFIQMLYTIKYKIHNKGNWNVYGNRDF